MLITRTSQATGVVRTMDLPVTDEQLITLATTNALVQDIFPDLTDSQREFIMTGITDDEWDEIFNEYESWSEKQYAIGSEFDDIPF